MEKNKLNARKVEFNGEMFDSKKECARWQQLLAMERHGEIRGLERQVPFTLLPTQKRDDGKTERGVKYVADFVYTDESNHLVVEDVKGYRGGAVYAVFVLKRKMMLNRYGISIKEI